jgi:hypothetical protein
MPNAATVEELTMNFHDEEGNLLVKELDKEVLTKGGWATLIFRYQDLDKAKGTFKAPKYAIRRFQKSNGEYKLKSKFVVSSAAQARLLSGIQTRWADKDADVAGASGASDEE